MCASSIFDHNAFLELVFSLTINFDGFLYNRFARFKICPFKSAWYTNSSSYFFFSRIRKRFTHLYIKVERFDAHNALPTSALEGLRDYNHRLNRTFLAIGYIF